MGNVNSNTEEEKSTTLSDVIFFIILILLIEVLIGTVGYIIFGRLNWIDSFRNAAFMAPSVGEPIHLKDTVGKVWSSLYALSAFVVAVVLIGTTAGRISAGA